MVIFGNVVIRTTFRYKVSWFSAEQQTKSQIKDSCGNSEFVTFTGALIPPVLFWISIINTNIKYCTGFGECLYHWPLQNTTHRGSEQLKWRSWWLVQALLAIFGRSDDLYNHRYFYFIVMGGQCAITSLILWVHGDVFKVAKKMCYGRSLIFALLKPV